MKHSKPLLKTFTTLALSLIMMFSLVLPVMANTNDVTPGSTEWMINEINRLTTENAELRAQLQAQPTPAPVFAPNPRLVTPHNVTVTPGDVIDVPLNMRNIGTHTAFNLLTTASPASGAPFHVEFLNNSNNINQIRENGTATITMRITVDANARPGSYLLTLNHAFRDQARANLSGTDAITVRVGGQVGLPNVRLGNFTSTAIGPIEPGQRFTVNTMMQNIGTANASQVQVTLPSLSADSIFFTGDLNQAFRQNMAADASYNLSFQFQAANNITSGTHPIEFRVTFRDEDGESTTETFTFFVNVLTAADEVGTHSLEIANMQAPSGTIRVDANGTFRFNLYNTGDVEKRNIRVTATSESPTAVVPMTASTVSVGTLQPGGSASLSFAFSPRDAAITRSYAIEFVVRYDVGTGANTESHEFSQFAAMNVYNPEQDENVTGVQIPRVIVADFELDPPVPRAGQEFTMSVSFRNTSANRSVNNVRILLEEVMGSVASGQQAAFAGFTRIGGSNTLFIDYIAPNGIVEMDLVFSTVNEASPGSHNMRFTFDYQDQAFDTHTANEQVSIPVAQVTRLELDGVNVGGWTPPMVGMEVPFRFTIINSGRVNLINLRVRAEGPFDVSQAGGEAGQFVGTINAQRTIGYDGAVVPFYPGENRGYFIITGEDITGEIVELRYPFSFHVQEGFGGGDRDGFGDGGGFEGDGFRGMPSGFMDPVTGNWIETSFFDRETGQMVDAGYWNEQGEWVATWEMDPMTGEWHPIGGDGFLAFITRPIVWVPALGVLVLVGIIVIVLVVRKSNAQKMDFDDDDL